MTDPDTGESTPIKVLYVDDSVFDRELVRYALEREHGGFRVVEASSREEFELCLTEADFDIVLSDFETRGFNGQDVIDIVRERYPNLPVVIVTSAGSEQQAVAAMKRGAADYVIKTSDQLMRLPDIALAALERSRLQEAHLKAEDAQRFLVQASAVLASSLDYEGTLRKLVHLAVPGLSDFCTIQVVDEKIMGGVMVAVRGETGEKVTQETWRPWRPGLEWHETLKQVLRSDAPRLTSEIPEPLLPVIANSAAQMDLLKRLQLASIIMVPVVARHRLVGLLILGRSPSSEPYSFDDLTLAAELAGRVALAVDNARLYRDAQEAIRARDEFLAMAAHELKTPVTSLKGFAQLAVRLINKADNPDLSQIRQAMQVIDQQSDKLTNLMQSLLDVSRIESNRLAVDLKVGDVSSIVRDAVEKLAVTSGRHNILVQAPSSAPALVDSVRLEQVITNLIDNAIKFSPDDKPIEVDVLTPASDTVQLSVRDYGIGIPPEQQKMIFERFYQAHGNGSRGGMGLGLFICKHIVDIHGGTLRVESADGGGTRFSVTLPVGIQTGTSPSPGAGVEEVPATRILAQQ